ncbi:MAG: PHP domain-containing protein [Desulfohalobiaceae bacterium]
MFIDCHLHTSRYSPCSILEPYQALLQAREAGLQGLVITEHQVQWSIQEVRELQSQFPDIAVFSGLEVTLAEDVDLVLIIPNQGLQIPFGLSFSSLYSRLQDVWEGSFVFLAHAFRWTDQLTPEAEEILPYIHGLEMSSVNILNGQYQQVQGKFKPKLLSAYQALRSKYDLLPIYNTDAHLKQAVGSIANYISCPGLPQDESELADILKSAEIREYQNSKLLGELLV